VNATGDKASKTRSLTTRISDNLYRVVQTYLERDACINESDLIRKALADYLERKIPEMYKEIMGLR
jgi:metal-responsive CopG/Arc/MetJ family transcriptional regulator